MSMIDLSQLLNEIKTEINAVVEKHLLPHFEKMKCNNENIKLIESVLRQMPDFQRLEKENADLKRELGEKTMPAPVVQSAPMQAQAVHQAPLPMPEPAQGEHVKLEIVESTQPENIVLESDLYKAARLTDEIKNIQLVSEVAEEEASEVAEEEAEEEEEEASEAAEEE